MLRWISVVTREDKIINEYIRGSTGVASTTDKTRKIKLGRLGHVLKKEETEAVRLVVKEMYIEGNRGRLMKGWLNVIESDVKRVGVSVDDAGDRVLGTLRTRVADPK